MIIYKECKKDLTFSNHTELITYMREQNFSPIRTNMGYKMTLKKRIGIIYGKEKSKNIRVFNDVHFIKDVCELGLLDIKEQWEQ